MLRATVHRDEGSLGAHPPGHHAGPGLPCSAWDVKEINFELVCLLISQSLPPHPHLHPKLLSSRQCGTAAWKQASGLDGSGFKS